jgi:hypothetical protein
MTDFSQWWWQAAAGPGPGPGPGPDAGDPIGQSLRFRGAQYLVGPAGVTTDTFTFSVWVKKAFLQDDRISGYILGLENNANGFGFYTDQLSQTVPSFYSQALYRDPSAWYNIVVNTTGKYWVNGEIVPDSPASITTPLNDSFVVGTLSSTQALSYAFVGYMAAVYCIDGQELDPTTFGRFNSQGVWVPVDPQGLTYGSNGFKLLFEDLSDLGKDYSGNGNDFTATGFETADTSSVDYDLMLDSPTQNYATWNPLGKTESGSLPLGPGVWTRANLTFQATTDDGTSSQLVYASNGTVGVTSGKWYFEISRPRITPGITPNNSWVSGWSTSLPKADPPNSAAWASVDNYAIFDALIGHTKADGATDLPPSFTPSESPNQVFAYAFDFDTTTNNCQLFVNNVLVNTISFDPGDKPLMPVFWSGYSSENDVNFGQKPFRYTPPAGFKKLQTQNLPAATIPNGRDHFQAITGPGQGADGGTPGQLAGDWSSSLFADNSGTTNTPNFNSTTPATLASAAFNGNTADGADAADANSTLIFRPEAAITATSSVKVFTTGQGRIWVNEVLTGITAGGSNAWVDLSPSLAFPISISNIALNGSGGQAGRCNAYEIDGEILVDANILAIAQSAFPDGLWWIKDRANNNQHQLVDSVRTNGFAIQTPSLGAAVAYVAPAGSSVAWCWNAPEAFTSTDGSIASAGMRNVDAGFSIIEYTGNSIAGATVGHGLSRAPEFMLVRDYAASNKLHYCYSEEIGNESYMYLQGSVPAGANSNIYWNSTSPTDTVFTLGVDANINAGGSQVICYAWHSVPNYSAFGTYKGNGNVDGPFVHTGMKIGFLLIKRTDSTANWYILDTTRQPINPNDVDLSPDLGGTEKTGSRVFDFLSNGFKVRQSYTSLNASGGTYLYAAFAENPFQSPATAR